MTERLEAKIIQLRKQLAKIAREEELAPSGGSTFGDMLWFGTMTSHGYTCVANDLASLEQLKREQEESSDK